MSDHGEMDGQKVFRVWLAGLTVSLLGTQVLTYGLSWTAAGISGTLSGIVLSVVALPRLVLAISAGALADRIGPWRIMLLSDCAMFFVGVGGYVLVLNLGPMPWVLVLIAALIGTSDAFYRPSSGAVPRLLVSESGLDRAVAARQAVNQVVGFSGPAIAGSVVTAFALQGAALSAAVGFLAMVVLMSILRKRVGQFNRAENRNSLLFDTWLGIRASASLPKVRTILLLLCCTAGFVLPLMTLLAPLLGHTNSWTAAQTGIVSGAFAGGLGTAALVVYRFGGKTLLKIPVVVGLVISGLAIVGIALSGTFWIAAIYSAVSGFGAGTFTVRTATALLINTPEELTSRIQASALLAQTIPMLIMNNVFGMLADSIGPVTVTVISGLCACSVGVLCLFIRSARRLE
ncbi:MFS transporter [Brevibacterium sediminis]|uniref:MFS transporter n=1 Tax=Brevibacterium sediminis TaxID=1857024 RepID=UPI002174F537|nr:MFS transporter [Brevibacterium sediminis]MCS4592687.1 MFS transporter [Brevibacterium sediminis]